MKCLKCCHLIGYFNSNIFDYGKSATYNNLYNCFNYSYFDFKKDFKFYKYCPLCGYKIDKVEIISNLYLDLCEIVSRRLFK